jgi:hypothetical protein
MDTPQTTPLTIAPTDIYCRGCRYPLRGLDTCRCPECGQPFEPGNPRTYFITPQASRTAVAALVLAIMGILTAVVGVGVLFLIGALILAKQALNEIDRADGSIPGGGLARGAAYISGTGLVVFAVAMAFVLPNALAPPRKSRPSNSTRMRGCLNALVLWSADYTTTDDFPGAGLGNCTGNSVRARFTALCTSTNNPLLLKVLVNPYGTDVVGSATNLLSTNISYALLDPKNPEWKNLTNAGAPLVCDKQVGRGSFWNTNQWEGNVGWGDVHTTYESSQVVSTLMNGTTYPQDDLWKQSGTNDALMVNP